MSRVTAKGQVTIPKAVREDLGIQPGDEVDFVKTESGAYRIRKVAPTTRRCRTEWDDSAASTPARRNRARTTPEVAATAIDRAPGRRFTPHRDTPSCTSRSAA